MQVAKWELATCLVRGPDDAVGGGMESNGPLTVETNLFCGDEEIP